LLVALGLNGTFSEQKPTCNTLGSSLTMQSTIDLRGNPKSNKRFMGNTFYDK